LEGQLTEDGEGVASSDGNLGGGLEGNHSVVSLVRNKEDVCVDIQRNCERFEEQVFEGDSSSNLNRNQIDLSENSGSNGKVGVCFSRCRNEGLGEVYQKQRKERFL